MICDRTYLCHFMTFRDLDLRSNFEVDLSRSTIHGCTTVQIYMVRFVSTRQTRWYHYYWCNFQNEKVIREKLFRSKQFFLLWWAVEANRLTLGQVGQFWRQYYDGEFNYISNAVFGFVLSIRDPYPEIMEGFRSDVRHSRKTRRFCFFCPGGHNF